MNASEFILMVRNAIDNMLSDSVTLETLRAMPEQLKGFSKAEVMSITKQLGISTATTKGGAIVRLRQKLLDLKATLCKTRMYG